MDESYPRPLHNKIDQVVAFEVPVEDNKTAKLEGILSYDVQDPLAINFTFEKAGHDGKDVTWAIGRLLLAEGINAPVGECDVRIQPHQDEDGRPTVKFDLKSPYGQVTLESKKADMCTFLSRVESMLPEQEFMYPDDELDRIISRILLGDKG